MQTQINKIGKMIYSSLMFIPNITLSDHFIQESVRVYTKLKILCILIRFHASHYMFKMAAMTDSFELFIY